ncbi:MAG: hypothetical protein ABSA16_00200 [Thermoguttaceae bacterium]|jgi:hypothetical protein
MTLEKLFHDRICSEPNHAFTFAELYKIGEKEGFPMYGDLAISLPNDLNLILWAGMSEEFFEAVKALFESGQIEREPTHVLTYLVDGRSLNLPVAKRPPKSGYKEPHWIPIVLRVKKQISRTTT